MKKSVLIYSIANFVFNLLMVVLALYLYFLLGLGTFIIMDPHWIKILPIFHFIVATITCPIFFSLYYLKKNNDISTNASFDFKKESRLWLKIYLCYIFVGFIIIFIIPAIMMIMYA